MLKNLVIVESPAKAKTIEKYLGKDFTVKSSFGHVRDLPKGNNAIDIKNGFIPTYEITEDKRQLVSELKRLVKDTETVWLATDDDREGEAISWHLKEALGLKDNTNRIVFREITQTAILNAISSPRTIDINLVNAQQARRVLDRLVGFELSPILWKKIQSGLSAGRVQSVAVRFVVEQERSIDKFESEPAFKTTATFTLPGGKSVKADLPDRFKEEKEAEAFLKKCIGAVFTVKDLQVKPAKKTPSPPFTTSTLQQEASRKMGYSVAQTMSIAQKLYEGGHISYMRTDSISLSEEALGKAKEEICAQFGKQYSETRKFKTKSASAQEAHEAIRPTDFSKRNCGEAANEQKLYELIWKRAIASQMSDAILEKTVAKIGVSTDEREFIAAGEVIKFDGFLKVYLESTDEELEDGEDAKGMLPKMDVGQILPLDNMKSVQRYSRPPARYTEASLVKKLEEMGIGRPSTYAPTISTIQKRGYVVKESREGKERAYRELTLANDKITSATKTEMTGAEKNKLFPTSIAMIVNDFLISHFPNVIDYSFTANVEELFDQIAGGKTVWNNMISDFYGAFHAQVEKTTDVERASTGATRVLGNDPKTGKEISVKLGRFGPYAQLGNNDDESKVYASLRKDQLIENISLEDALELFKLPREVGMFEDQKMVAAIGKFGPYIRHDGKFVSLPKDQDPLSITEEEAIALIVGKRESDAQKLIKAFEGYPELQILNGRWGPYLKSGKDNIKIPKTTDAAALTLEECLDMVEKAAPAKTPAKAGAKTSAAAKTEEAETPAKTTKKAPVKAKTPAKKAEATAKKPAAKKPAAKKKD